MTSPSLLIIGSLPPTQTAGAAATMQTALYFLQQKTQVTLVISDYAPPSVQPLPEGLTTLRERALKQQQTDYKDTPRLYILDDTVHSLFAYRLLQEAPGTVMYAEANMHKLLRAYMETLSDWPHNYDAWLTEKLGNAGTLITQTISAHGRESLCIKDEIFVEASMVGSNATIIDPLLPFTPTAKSTHNVRASLNIPDDAKLIVSVSCSEMAASAARAVADLQVLGKKVHHVTLGGAEANMVDIVTAADIIVLLQDGKKAPSALSCALQNNKPIIAAGSWAHLLPEDTRLLIPDANAHHHLVAALGALLNGPTREWLQKGMQYHWQQQNVQEHWQACLKEILTTATSPLNLEVSTESNTHCTTHNVTIKLDDTTETFAGQIALIGSVPPYSLLKQHYPDIAWDSSPRFATPQLAELLAFKTGKSAAIILAEMGYESPLLITDETVQQTPHNSSEKTEPNKIAVWQDIQSELKKPLPVLAFTCSLKEATNATLPVCDFTLALRFPQIELKRRQTVTKGYIKESGCFWHLNLVEHKIDCVLITGKVGTFRLSLLEESDYETTGLNACFLIADKENTSIIGPDKNATTNTDSLAIAHFSLIALDPVSLAPLETADLLTAIAAHPLQLTYESEMVTE